MNRVWVGTLAAAVVVAALAVVLATRAPSPQIEPAPIRTSFEHAVVGFGDRVHARAVVVLETKTSAGARVNVSVAPLLQIGTTRVTRVSGHGYEALTYDIDAVCIYDECVASGGRKLVHLPDVTVTAPSGGLIAKAPWPALDVRGRVVKADLAPNEPPLKYDALPPPVDYRFAPSSLARFLEVLAAVLAAAGVALVGRQVAAIVRQRATWAEPLTELEQALALAREAESRPAPDRRRALALLERLLRPRDERLATEARNLAWSSPPPGPEDVDDLVSEVESKVRS